MVKMQFFKKSVVGGLMLLTIVAGCNRSQPSKPPPTHVPTIVSLKPNVTEILFQLGLGDKIVGVTKYCLHPPEAQKITKVADYVQANLEKIIALKPDLVITSHENSTKREIVTLEKLGIRVLTLPFYSLQDIFDSTEVIGEATGAGQRAASLVSEMKRDIQEIQDKIKGLPPPKALIVLDHRPLVVAGGGSLFDELMVLLGVENIAHQSKIRYPHFSTELMIGRAPEVILDMAMAVNVNNVKNKEGFLEWYQSFSSIPAVKNNNIHFLDVSLFHPSARIIEGIREMAKIFYPKVFFSS